MWNDFWNNIDKAHIYDLETYPNIFTFASKEADSDNSYLFEISWRRNDMDRLREYLYKLLLNKIPLVGFNNIGFDYPILHHLIASQFRLGAEDLYKNANQIINSGYENRFHHRVNDQDWIIPQIDLYLIHHFDNPARATSLKVIEFNMRMDEVQDLPFPPGTLLRNENMDALIDYNMNHDVVATKKFFEKSRSHIDFRRELTLAKDRPFINSNSTKVGKDYFIMEMEKNLPGFTKTNQTFRDKIEVKDVVLPYITFDHPEFRKILQFFKEYVLYPDEKGFFDLKSIKMPLGVDSKGKEVFVEPVATINGFEFGFGGGGIHGSVNPCVVKSTPEDILEDWDVASYYPNLAISNNFYPKHLGPVFCEIYRDVYEQRKMHPKKSVINETLKLALNGVYGDSNNIYSCFYDPQYTLSITINGQLLLCMLAEKLMVAGVKMVQINTDGLTIKYPRHLKDWVHSLARWWEKMTGLVLEDVEYKRMFIRDVNNYIGEYIDGKRKRKGVFCYETPLDNPDTKEMEWHKDHSALIIPKAAEAALLGKCPVRRFIEDHKDIYDFLLRTKVPRSSKLMVEDYEGYSTQVQNVSRYYISTFGKEMYKLMPPTPAQLRKDPNAPYRRISINKDRRVTICNNINDIFPDDIEYEYYINQTYDLTMPILKGEFNG